MFIFDGGFDGDFFESCMKSLVKPDTKTVLISVRCEGDCKDDICNRGFFFKYFCKSFVFDKGHAGAHV